MSTSKTIRAWRDEDYRLSLSAAERAAIEPNPVGAIELDDNDLEGVTGGEKTFFRTRVVWCWTACYLCKP